MSMNSIIRAFALATLSLSGSAFALQPLESFVRAAHEGSPDNLEARASLAQQQAQADAVLGGALPGLSARGTYTRNQHATELDLKLDPNAPPVHAVITPLNQLDGTLTLNVPLVDLARFQRIGAARTGATAAEHQTRATHLQVEANVTQGYYQLVANGALVDASRRALDVSRESLRLTEARFGAGTAAALDVDRAQAEVERQVQQLASAELGLTLSARTLQSLTGLTPELENLASAAVQDDLHTEPSLETFVPQDAQLPLLAASLSLTEAAEKQARAQRLTLLPTLSGSVTERFTNAAGFSGHSAQYQALLNLNWALDYTTFANIRVQDAAASVAKAREERTRRATHDAIHRAWSQVNANIAKSRSARAQVQASNHASELALDRYQVGATTQLDLLQAQRDAFSAEVSRIQADAELANARLQLRLAAGQDPFSTPPAPSGS
ncbi:TolC family protein [Corallococcus sp. H22C18031201]|nr:TolC family protein [Corallococcus sp. H22C18031201]